MKTISKVGVLILLAGSLFMSSCAGSYYVTARPVEPVYERPVVPYQGAVWVEGEWVWSGGNYTFMRGHWERPAAGRAWVKGFWENTPRGYRWHKGHWA